MSCCVKPGGEESCPLCGESESLIQYVFHDDDQDWRPLLVESEWACMGCTNRRMCDRDPKLAYLVNAIKPTTDEDRAIGALEATWATS